MDDQDGWKGRIARNKYRILERKELLVGRNAKQDDVIYVKGICHWTNIPKERVKTYVVKAINKDPQYMYSKQIFYIDPEYWVIVGAEKYDREEKLWKFADYTLGKYTAPNNEIIVDAISQMIGDIQRKHFTLARNAAITFYKESFPLQRFTPGYLNRIGR